MNISVKIGGFKKLLCRNFFNFYQSWTFQRVIIFALVCSSIYYCLYCSTFLTLMLIHFILSLKQYKSCHLEIIRFDFQILLFFLFQHQCIYKFLSSHRNNYVFFELMLRTYNAWCIMSIYLLSVKLGTMNIVLLEFNAREFNEDQSNIVNLNS